MPGDLWVFAYGSLVWDPGMALAESVRARLDGHHRAFCMWSIHHRGTPERPGLVLALEERAGAICEGLALRPADPEAALPALRERELISSAYREATVPLRLADGRAVRALAYVMDPGHRQYASGLDLDAQARVIACAAGGRGPNPDYLDRTAAALAAHGIRDAEIEGLAARVARLRHVPPEAAPLPATRL
jgi:cation transport protein ChaC